MRKNLAPRGVLGQDVCPLIHFVDVMFVDVEEIFESVAFSISIVRLDIDIYRVGIRSERKWKPKYALQGIGEGEGSAVYIRAANAVRCPRTSRCGIGEP
jgi:hypothetical protein